MQEREKTVMVIGGGIAGVTASLDLAESGLMVTLAEQDDFIGGHAALLACKAAGECQGCNGCLAHPRLEQVMTHPGINILRRTRVTAISRGENGFEVELETRPAYIDPESCTACGICLERCPEPGAIRQAMLSGDSTRLALDQGRCLHFVDGRSNLCSDVCPEEAISFDLSAERSKVQAGALVLASGFTPYAAEEKIRLGYGRVPNVVTAMELEDQLRREGRPIRPSDGQSPKRVAFIQCVGSRETGGNNYCSRVCCGYALRLGRALTNRFDAEVSVYYMDLQSFGFAIDDFLAAAAEEMNLIRSMPYDVWPGEGDRVLVEYQPRTGEAAVREPYDLLVLSVGMTPGGQTGEMARVLGLERDSHGFVPEGAEGIFIAGAAARPMDVSEVVAHAGRAARETIGYLEAF